MTAVRLQKIADMGSLPFDLDFLRAIGFSFQEDWDGEIIVQSPAIIDPEAVIKLVRKFDKGIKTRLYFERKKALGVCFGGPMNGKPFENKWTGGPVIFHIKRAEWAVYAVRFPDPRAWFIGMAKNKRQAGILWYESEQKKKQTP
jgi:hypothetical protein